MNKFFNDKAIPAVLDLVSDGIQIVDKNGMLVYCNRKSAIVDDINIEESLGKYILDIYPSLSKDSSTILKVLKTGYSIIDKEQSYHNYKGKNVSTLNTTLPIVIDGELLGAVEISRNITDIKELSEKYVDLKTKVYGEKGKATVNIDVSKYTFDDILTVNDEFEKIKSIARRAAKLEIPVLISGETGTGKELLVQSIHSASERRNKPFIAQNCAALPSGLLEGILFGSTKGGFTGAADRAGLFELADGGTLFLDELNSMPLELQAKLLRVLQDGVVRRIGDIRSRKVDVRVIAATNIDPVLAMDSNLLRSDLYFRLSTLSLNIPPLRDRPEDIPVLVKFFIGKYNEKTYRNVKNVSRETLEIFNLYKWPGNVRELEHIIERAVSLSEASYIDTELLPSNLLDFSKTMKGEAVKDFSLKKALEDTESRLISRALKDTGNNISKSAKLLGIPRQTLQSKLKKYGNNI
ncbi:MAG: sigma 54-interacting transcriptional regulator [Acidaminobacteraceae bacterium]